jgi:integrase
MTAPKRLTTARIECAREQAGDVWISDNDGSRGGGRLVIRIGPSGTRIFYFKYSHNKRPHTIALGRYSRTQVEGYLTLEQARATARHCSAVLRDPKTTDVKQALGPPIAEPTPASKLAPVGDSAIAPGCTLLDLCSEYHSFLEKRRSASSAKSCQCDINNYIEPTPWACTPANKLSPKDVTTLLREIAKRCTPDKANRVRSLLMAAYGLAIRSSLDPNASVDLSRFEIPFNPVRPIVKLETSSQSLDRALSAIELGHFWLYLTGPTCSSELKFSAVRISLLLGGQRCMQLLRATTSNVSILSRTLTLFDGKGKRKKPHVHVLPLTDLALSEIEPLLIECKDLGRTHLFQGRIDGAPMGNDVVSRAVRDISAVLLQDRKIEAPFRYRDIRRTIETRMTDLEISKEARAQVQSHDLGGVQMAHYNRHDFLKQKREALAQWQRYLLECAEAAKAAAPTERHRRP